VHERLAFDDVMATLSKYGFVKQGSSETAPVLIHCFTGTREEMQAYVNAGFSIGISGHFLSKRGEDQREWLQVGHCCVMNL